MVYNVKYRLEVYDLQNIYQNVTLKLTKYFILKNIYRRFLILKLNSYYKTRIN